MSTPMSEKCLRYLTGEGLAAPVTTVETDLHCPQCGYNLRGLRLGQRCPECGHDTSTYAAGRPLDVDAGTSPVTSRRSATTGDVFASMSSRARRGLRRGFTLLGLVLVAAVLARVTYFGLSVTVPRPLWVAIFAGTIIGLALLWVVATVLVFRRDLIRKHPDLAGRRRAVLLTQPLWVAGTVLWLADAAAGIPPLVGLVESLATVVAFCGLLVGLGMLVRLAEDAELLETARRIRTCLWLLPITAFLQMQTYGVFPWIIVPLLVFVLFFWGWTLVALAAGLWQLRAHVHWLIVYSRRRSTRDDRVTARRTALQNEVESKIRPERPRVAPDIPIDIPLDSPKQGDP